MQGLLKTHLVGVLLTSPQAVSLGQELDVGATALEPLLELDLVLNDERLGLGGIDRLREESGDGVMGSLGLCRVSAHDREYRGERGRSGRSRRSRRYPA